jgi:predicted nucleic acid-binding Zn ribbon protein
VTRRRAPRQAGEAFRVARDRVAPKTGLGAVQAVWTQAVGESIAAVTAPVSERAGTVTVECSESVWAQQLDLMQAQLLESLREKLGERAPQALKFRVARGS